MNTAVFCGRQKWRIAVCGLVSAGVALSVSIAAAAEIKPVKLSDDRVEISVTGEIAPGDADLLRAHIKAANDAGKQVTSLRLNSDGGNLLESVLLAEVVKSTKISTNVGRNATCASACFLIFAAGATKYANYRARIGVHGAADKGGASRAATTFMADVAKDIRRDLVNHSPHGNHAAQRNDLA